MGEEEVVETGPVEQERLVQCRSFILMGHRSDGEGLFKRRRI